MTHPNPQRLFRGLVLGAFCVAGCGGAPSRAEGAPRGGVEDGTPSAGAAAEDAPPFGDAEPASGADADAEPAAGANEPEEDDKTRKARLAECGRLIRASNHEQRFLREASKRLASSDPASLEALADALEDSGRRIGSVSLRDPELSRLRGDYRAMFVRQASECRNVARALEAKDDAKARAAQAALSEVAADETRIARAIHTRCSPR